MAAPTIRVELGLELASNPNTAILDDPVKGVLDSPTYTLGGVAFYDITSRVRNVTTNRGKSQALDRIDAGTITVLADNSDRLFDPLFTSSQFYGALIPRRQMRLYANDKFVYQGFIDDFNLDYDINNQSTVTITCSDAFSTLTKAVLENFTPSIELSGARIQTVLNRPEVNWLPTARDIDTGTYLMLDTTVDAGTNALEYLQLVANSEFGNLFISKDGKLVFRDSAQLTTLPSFVITDESPSIEPNGIPFADIKIVYGSEYLYNKVTISNSDTVPDEVTLENTASQQNYGILAYSATGLLTSSITELTSVAVRLLKKYEQPVYRFESVTHVLDVLSEAQQNKILNVEIGDLVEVHFTPNDIPPAIEQYCRVIGINHNWDNDVKTITFALEKLEGQPWTLSDVLFGRLTAGNFLG